MPAKAIELSPSVGELLRERRRSLGFTLRDVEQMSSSHGSLIPYSTLARIEQGRLDPGLKRLHALLQLYGLPIQAAGDLLDMEAIAGSVSVTGSFEALRDRGEQSWQAGDLPTAMACHLAMRHHAGDRDADRAARHESILALAVMAAKLGKHHIARQVLDELVLDHPAKPMLLRALVQLASTWHALGAPEPALAIVAGAETLVDADDPRGRGWVLQLRASIQIDLAAFDDALANLASASRLFERARRPYDRALALVAAARAGVERGDFQGAIRAARKAASFASQKRFARARALASLQEARALLGSGDPAGAVRVLTDVLAETAASPDNVIRFYAHFYLSKAHAAAGDLLRSRVELEQARSFVRFIDQGSKEAAEARGHAPPPRVPVEKKKRPRSLRPR